MQQQSNEHWQKTENRREPYKKGTNKSMTNDGGGGGGGDANSALIASSFKASMLTGHSAKVEVEIEKRDCCCCCCCCSEVHPTTE